MRVCDSLIASPTARGFSLVGEGLAMATNESSEPHEEDTIESLIDREPRKEDTIEISHVIY